MHFLPSSIHSIHAKPKPFLSSPIPCKRHLTGHVQAVSVSCRATTTTFYEVLSLSPDKASIDEVKKAYRTMALRYHPDVCPPLMKEESTRMFVQLNAAYRTLSDPVLRKEYDCEILMEGFGRSTFGRTSRMGGVDHDRGTRSRWEQQIVELKRRSNCRMAEKEGSWGSRIRAHNMRNKEY
ncbi:chaperone protein dnaJ 20, chloroplastic-like [Juglans regia]|uniref:Chaperone protein dnaJ 20, chloroplastic-like n=1 Tax=Juglans regia TaxID=51240 RepID=A0A6P9EH40_JUGRE|nr:chaperone protein dnaJ 20, chloroplastic-like [Juglans regia]